MFSTTTDWSDNSRSIWSTATYLPQIPRQLAFLAPKSRYQKRSTQPIELFTIHLYLFDWEKVFLEKRVLLLLPHVPRDTLRKSRAHAKTLRHDIAMMQKSDVVNLIVRKGELRHGCEDSAWCHLRVDEKVSIVKHFEKDNPTFSTLQISIEFHNFFSGPFFWWRVKLDSRDW